ncbi:MAG: hypothetical protein V3V68_04920 [Nitrosomonadaceae bacterium]
MTIIIFALAVATISMTLTQSSLFEAIRKTLECKVVRCPYCVAHWVSFSIWSCHTFTYPKTIDLFIFAINVFATVALSVLPMIVIDYLNTRIDKNAKILHSPHG